jgi:DMSO/TMAO reductase YedYZ heme-binding membrane subunit
MSWHFLFVAYFLVTFGYHMRAIDLTLDIIGLCFLIAMTLTSFPRFARRLSVANWRRLHRTGIYTLWFLPVFFFLDDYLKGRDPLYLEILAVLFAALALRLLAWRHTSVAVLASPERGSCPVLTRLRARGLGQSQIGVAHSPEAVLEGDGFE